MAAGLGSSTRIIIRAGSLLVSGREANSTKLTSMTPSVAAMLDGKGSFGARANAQGAISNTAPATRVMRTAAPPCSPTRVATVGQKRLER